MTRKSVAGWRFSESSDTESGDTLVEVLAALVIIGLTVVSILGAFATTLAATVEQRNLANYNADLRGLVETASYQISLQQSPAYVACAVTGTYQSIANTYKTKIGFSGSLKLSVVQYVPAAPSNGCTNSPTAATPPQAPLQPQPQMIKATIGPAAPSSRVWDRIYFVVSDPHVTDTSGVSPSIATAGATVTITGTDLSNATQVNWGSATIPSGSFLSDTSTSIAVSAPTVAQAGSTSPAISVTSQNGTSASFGPFTYLTLTSIFQTSGPPGTLVTLTGTGFTGANSVIFGTGASKVTVPSGSFVSDTSTTITLHVPSGISGTVPVFVTSVTNNITYTSTSNPPVTFTETIPLTFSPSTLPNGTVGTAYSQTVTASGGTAPYTYSVASGSLPAGLSLNTSTGAITGTPTTAASYTFTIGATDSASPVHNTGSQSYTVTVTNALIITSVSGVGSHTTVTFSGTGASGSSTPVTVTVYTSAALTTIAATASTSNSPTNPWTTGSTGNNQLNTNTEYWAQAKQGSATSAAFPFFVEAGQQPQPVKVALANGTGSTAKKADAGDTVTVTFSEPLNAASLCSAWGNTGTQTITDANLRFSAGLLESTLTVSSSVTCGATNFGTVGAGAIYVSTSSGSDAADFSNSTVTWDPTNLTLVFKLGSLTSGAANIQTNVTPGKPDYTAVAAMKDLGGNAASTTKFTSGTTSGF